MKTRANRAHGTQCKHRLIGQAYLNLRLAFEYKIHYRVLACLQRSYVHIYGCVVCGVVEAYDIVYLCFIIDIG